MAESYPLSCILHPTRILFSPRIEPIVFTSHISRSPNFLDHVYVSRLASDYAIQRSL